jgi:hypothetical protein
VLSILFVAAIAVLAAPFVLSSLAVDRHGVEVAGSVYSKHEYVHTRHSTWKRTTEVMIECWPPDESSVRYFTSELKPADYDTLHKGQRVNVHYLRRADIPKIPFAETLGQLHMLPVARLAGRSMFSSFQEVLDAPARMFLLWAGGVVALLIVWRASRLPGFAWAVAVCVLVTVAAFLVYDFPTPTPAPGTPMLQATARVQNLETIEWLFRGSRSRGIAAAQPIQVVALEFVPAGRTEPVVAIDAIDAGSVAGIKQDAKLPLDYEAGSPRTAHLRGATRNFASRNLGGIGMEIAGIIAVILGFFVLSKLAGRAWKRIIASR